MRLYQRDNSPYWWMEYFINGKKVRKSTKRTLNDKAGANKVLAKAYNEAQNVTQGLTKIEITLGDAFDRHIETLRADKTIQSYSLVKRKTLGLDRFNVKGHYSLPASMLCSQVTDEHIEKLARDRLAKGLKPNSMNNELRVLRAILYGLPKRYAASRDLEWPMEEAFEKTRFLSDQETKDLVAYLKDRQGSPSWDKAHDLCLYLLYTGSRVSEALDLDWGSVNMTKRVIERNNTKTGGITATPMVQQVYDILSRRKNNPRPFTEMSRAIKCLREAITAVTKDNEAMNATRGVPTIHTLRDTFASDLAEKNLSLVKIAVLLGHKSPTMTRKYAHIVPQAAAEEARQLIEG